MSPPRLSKLNVGVLKLDADFAETTILGWMDAGDVKLALSGGMEENLEVEQALASGIGFCAVL